MRLPGPAMRSYRIITDRWPLLAIWGFGTISWAARTHQCTSDDCWFYNVIARNMVLHGQHSFSGVFPTNGVHPLWLYVLAGYSYLLAVLDPSLLYRDPYAVPLASGLALWGAWNLSRVADKTNLPRLLVAELPLVFMMTFGLLYSEAHILFAALSWLLWISVSRRLDNLRGGIYAGLLVGLVFLARLDLMFLVGAYAVWYALHIRRLTPVVGFAIAAALLVLPYLAVNWAFFGSVMPVSGWMKSSFPETSLKGLGEGGLSTTLFGFNIVFGIAPILFALVVLLRAGRRSTRINDLARVLWFGAAGQFAYVALFTRSHTSWYWYYVLSVVLGALTGGIAWHEMWPVPSRRPGSAASGKAAVASALLVAAFIGVTVKARWAQGMERYPATLRTLKFIHNHALHHKALLLSDWPGYVAFTSDNYVVAADMLTLNRRLYDQMRSSPDALQFLLSYCRQEGRPVEYVIYCGNRWLVPTDDLRSAVFYDPRQYPAMERIGGITFPEAPVEVIADGGRPRFAVWRLSVDGSSAP